jgi:hypothetical protein
MAVRRSGNENNPAGCRDPVAGIFRDIAAAHQQFFNSECYECLLIFT